MFLLKKKKKKQTKKNRKNRKKITQVSLNTPLNKLTADPSFDCAFIRRTCYHMLFYGNVEKKKL